VNTPNTLAVLHALLERVRSRAKQVPAVRTASISPASTAEFDDSIELTTLPPPPEDDVALEEAEIAVDVEPPRAVQDRGADVALASRHATGTESVERLVAAEATTSAPTLEEGAATHADSSTMAPTGEAPALPAEEEIPPSPISSRRPVALPAEEHLADMAFGAEEPQPPRHTPPPESGRLPAAPVEEFDPDVTGVRPAPAGEREAIPELVPEVTQPNLSAAILAADIQGQARALVPATFLELLDLSLGLEP
jgi:hypothetical protein